MPLNKPLEATLERPMTYEQLASWEAFRNLRRKG